jgi:hypothetical protein
MLLPDEVFALDILSVSCYDAGMRKTLRDWMHECGGKLCWSYDEQKHWWGCWIEDAEYFIHGDRGRSSFRGWGESMQKAADDLVRQIKSFNRMELPGTLKSIWNVPEKLAAGNISSITGS